jgi:hypothetical protein
LCKPKKPNSAVTPNATRKNDVETLLSLVSFVLFPRIRCPQADLQNLIQQIDHKLSIDATLSLPLEKFVAFLKEDVHNISVTGIVNLWPVTQEELELPIEHLVQQISQ